MLDLARRCRLGIRAWICSVQKCCRQHPACLKCPLTFHSRGNPCLCSLCVLHNSYRMHFFFPGRLPSACQTCTAAWSSVFNDWICFNSSPLVVLVFILFSHSVILTFLVHGQLVFLFPRSRLFCLSIDARPPPGPVLLTQLPDKAAAANSVEKLSGCPGCEHLTPPPCDFNLPTFVYLFIFCWIANSYTKKYIYPYNCFNFKYVFGFPTWFPGSDFPDWLYMTWQVFCHKSSGIEYYLQCPVKWRSRDSSGTCLSLWNQNHRPDWLRSALVALQSFLNAQIRRGWILPACSTATLSFCVVFSQSRPLQLPP